MVKNLFCLFLFVSPMAFADLPSAKNIDREASTGPQLTPEAVASLQTSLDALMSAVNAQPIDQETEAASVQEIVRQLLVAKKNGVVLNLDPQTMTNAQIEKWLIAHATPRAVAAAGGNTPISKTIRVCVLAANLALSCLGGPGSPEPLPLRMGKPGERSPITAY